MSVLQKAYPLVVLTLLLCSTALAAECITPYSHAKRYFGADLVVFGEVLSCTTRVVSEEYVPGDSGWVYQHTSSIAEARMRVDSLLRGSGPDSIIVIQKNSTQAWRSRFDKVTETGDSLYFGEMAVLPGPGEASEVPSSGSWILFLTEKNERFEFMWRADYNKLNLDLYRIFADVGDSVFELYDLSGWIVADKDSVPRLQFKKK